MRLLITTLHFDAHPEGICTGRLVRALLEAGVEVTVVTSDEADTSFTDSNLNYIVVPNRKPSRFVFGLVNRLTRTPGSYYFWCRKVAALAPKLRGFDLIYGRSSPISSGEAAWGVARRLRQPFWVHYSDPFPFAWAGEGSPLFRRQAAYSRRLLAAAQAVTFTTPQALKYQQWASGTPIESKSFVLQHIGPAPALLPPKSGETVVFAYVGSFYGKRNASALLSGFSEHLRSHQNSKFVFVGTNPEWVIPDATRLGILQSIEVTQRVKDVRPYLANANVLVALDADCGEPVFMTTKIVEYLLCNRPVLMITPPNSPSAELVSRFPSTTVLVREAADEISRALSQASAIRYADSEFLQRFRGMEDFSASFVARKFISEVERRLR